LEHYQLTAPLIEASFSGVPLIYRNYPNGIDTPGAFHFTCVPLSVNKLLWLIHAKYAIEFYTWAPLALDQGRLRFGRVLLEAPPGVAFERVKLAALAIRALLFDTSKLEAVAMLDGGSGIALWIPLADAPQAADLRPWLTELAHWAAAKQPDLISTEANVHHDGRVHVHVSSNAPWRCSAVPYSLRAQGLTVCTPIRWDELESFDSAAAVRAAAFPQRLHEHGDVFAREVAVIAGQRFDASSDVARDETLREMRTTPEPRGHIITAAIEILGDGKPRDAKELLHEALERKLIPPNTTYHYVYTALIEYIARQLGRGRNPPILQDAQRRFRINEPLDDWPDVATLPPAQEDPDAQALCQRLEKTGAGDDPAAFETAVCDAFAHLGFLTQHLGDRAQPDGIADAILGPLGYRVLLECKTARRIVTQPDAAEAAKFRDAFKADRCVLVGPDFSDEIELLQELQTHRVTALTVPDIATLLHVGANPLEVQRLLVPGYACDVMSDLLWERGHGLAKRVATIAFLLAREGWQAQRNAAEQRDAGDPPRLTVDAAMLLVDTALRNAGSSQACARAEVEQAFAYLASPNVGAAVRDGDALVILRDLAACVRDASIYKDAWFGDHAPLTIDHELGAR
jgi:DNA primase